jgi:putative membrane protein
MTDAALIALAEHSHHWGGPGFFWPIFPIVWFVLIAGGIITAIVLSRRRHNLAPRREAEAALATRFASGEIGEDEYRSRRAVLRDKP